MDWTYLGTAQFFLEYLLISQERVKLRNSNLAGIFAGSMRTKAQQKFGRMGEKEALAYPGTAQIVGVPLIISGTGKATNFKLFTNILSIDRNKSPIQISGKVAVGAVGLSKFFRATIYWAHRAVVFAIAQLSCFLEWRETQDGRQKI